MLFIAAAALGSQTIKVSVILKKAVSFFRLRWKLGKETAVMNSRVVLCLQKVRNISSASFSKDEIILNHFHIKWDSCIMLVRWG